MTSIEIIAGPVIALTSALIGAWAGAKLNFGYQQKLLDQQLDSHNKELAQLKVFISELQKQFLEKVKMMDNHLAAIARRMPGGAGYIQPSKADEPEK